MSLVKFESIELDIVEDDAHEFLLTTKEVALGYGCKQDVIRQNKYYHSDELIENKHFIISRNTKNQKIIQWTKKGIIRLGFFIKSKQAKKFRDWAEDYIVSPHAENNQIKQLQNTIMAQNKLIAEQSKQNQPLLENKGTMNIFKEEMERMSKELEKQKELTKHYRSMAELQIERITIYKDTEEMLSILRSGLIKDVSKLEEDDNRRKAFLIVIEQLAKSLLMFKEVELKATEEINNLSWEIRSVMRC